MRHESLRLTRRSMYRSSPCRSCGMSGSDDKIEIISKSKLRSPHLRLDQGPGWKNYDTVVRVVLSYPRVVCVPVGG